MEVIILLKAFIDIYIELLPLFTVCGKRQTLLTINFINFINYSIVYLQPGVGQMQGGMMVVTSGAMGVPSCSLFRDRGSTWFNSQCR